MGVSANRIASLTLVCRLCHMFSCFNVCALCLLCPVFGQNTAATRHTHGQSMGTCGAGGTIKQGKQGKNILGCAGVSTKTTSCIAQPAAPGTKRAAAVSQRKHPAAALPPHSTLRLLMPSCLRRVAPAASGGWTTQHAGASGRCQECAKIGESAVARVHVGWYHASGGCWGCARTGEATTARLSHRKLCAASWTVHRPSSCWLIGALEQPAGVQHEVATSWRVNGCLTATADLACWSFSQSNTCRDASYKAPGCL